MHIHQIDDHDIGRLNDVVRALNEELARCVKKYGRSVEFRPSVGFDVGEYAYVKVEITHGRMSVGGRNVVGAA